MQELQLRDLVRHHGDEVNWWGAELPVVGRDKTPEGSSVGVNDEDIYVPRVFNTEG